MTKEEAMDLQRKYDMEFIRRFSGDGTGVRLVSEEAIAEFERLFKKDLSPCMIVDWGANDYDYRLFCPSEWFDLDGWANN